MNRPFALIASTVILAASVTACASTGSGRTGPTPNPEASASAASAAAASASASASQSSAIAAEASSIAAAENQPCTTHSCIAQDAEQSLPGAVAGDNSVITKATCYKRTVVHHAAAGVYTVECRAYYSDGTSVTGDANLLLAKDKITFQPLGT